MLVLCPGLLLLLAKRTASPCMPLLKGILHLHLGGGSFLRDFGVGFDLFHYCWNRVFILPSKEAKTFVILSKEAR